MGTTFRIGAYQPGQKTLPPQCPKCGGGNGTPGDPACDQKMPDGMECMGYGDTSNGIPGDDEMDVAEQGARIIIRELLNYGAREKDTVSGTLDPSDVLIRLTTAEFRVSSLVRPPSESQGVILTENGVAPGAKMVSFGIDEERLQRYVDGLRALAEKAAERGEEIHYA